MTSALLGSKEKSSGGQICENMTSGGTESILLAVKSSRDYMKARKGITRPEMIIPESAHSAYDKDAQYFNIKLWCVPVKLFAWYGNPLVSVDFRCSDVSSTVDASLTMVMRDDMVKVIAWYDNEWGYSERVVDLADIVAINW